MRGRGEREEGREGKTSEWTRGEGTQTTQTLRLKRGGLFLQVVISARTGTRKNTEKQRKKEKKKRGNEKETKKKSRENIM